MINKWKIHDQLPFNYAQFERVLTQRNSILETANIKTGKRSWIPNAIHSNLLLIVKQSVNFGFKNDAIKAIAKMKTLEKQVNEMEVFLEDAKLNIETNVVLAKSCLEEIMDERNIDCDALVKSHAYRIYGEILAENYSCDIIEIGKKFFDKSMLYLERYAKCCNKSHLVAKLDINQPQSSQEESQQTVFEVVDNETESKIINAACIYDTIAKFYDREYEFKVAYLKSHDFKQKKESYGRNLKKAQQLAKEIRTKSKDVQRSYHILNKSNDLDKQEIENAEKDKKYAARNAI